MKNEEKRNKRLVTLRDKDPKEWSFTALGKKFGIHKVTAFEIYHREKSRSREEKRNKTIKRKYPNLYLN